MFVCNRKVTTLFWRLQQVNQFNWELTTPPPPHQTGLLHKMSITLGNDEDNMYAYINI